MDRTTPPETPAGEAVAAVEGVAVMPVSPDRVSRPKGKVNSKASLRAIRNLAVRVSASRTAVRADAVSPVAAG